MALPDDIIVAPTEEVGQPLLPDHLEYLEKSGISAAYLEKTPLIRSAETQADLPDYFREREDITHPRGILFGWRTKGGSIEWQLRLDEPLSDPETGRIKKYLMRAGSGIRYGLILKRSGSKVLIVEGTKQGHAVAAAIDMNTTVIQIPGCAGWSRDGWQVPDDLVRLSSGKQVYILLDADAAENPDVFEAGERLAKGLSPLAKAVRFIPCPGGGKSGIDDFLAGLDERERKTTLQTLVGNSTARPAQRKPSARAKLTVLRGGRDAEKSDDSGYIGDQEWAWTPSGKLRYDTVSRHIMAEHPVALAGADQLAVYQDGAYSLAPSALKALVGRLLRDEMDTSRFNNLTLRLLGVAHDEGAALRDRLDEPLVPVLNGVVDLRTGQLLPHSPEYRLPYKLNVQYGPSAECPTYEKWLHSATLVDGHDQVGVLEDAACQMLDLAARPEKALFLVGPTRSGKSTFLSLLKTMAGAEMCSSTTLHQLSEDTFAAADLYGKLLNVDADMPDGYVPDTSVFKKLTGGDVVRANPKHKTPFSFVNSAMLAFSANVMPTVGEKSRAFVARSVPVSFPVSYLGGEDRSLGKQLESELSGIFNRWMLAWRARQARGGAFLPANSRVMAQFEESTDAVRAFVREALWVWPQQGGEGWTGEKTISTTHSTNWKSLFPLYEEWAGRTNRGATNFKSFQERLLQVPGITNLSGELRDTSKNKSYVVNVSPVSHADWGQPKIAILGKTTTPPKAQRVAAPVVEVPLVSLKDMGPIVLYGTTPAPAATAAQKAKPKKTRNPAPPAPSVDWDSTKFIVPSAVKGAK